MRCSLKRDAVRWRTWGIPGYEKVNIVQTHCVEEWPTDYTTKGDFEPHLVLQGPQTDPGLTNRMFRSQWWCRSSRTQVRRTMQSGPEESSSTAWKDNKCKYLSCDVSNRCRSNLSHSVDPCIARPSSLGLIVDGTGRCKYVLVCLP
jgi:hypothetical protein